MVRQISAGELGELLLGVAWYHGLGGVHEPRQWVVKWEIHRRRLGGEVEVAAPTKRKKEKEAGGGGGKKGPRQRDRT